MVCLGVFEIRLACGLLLLFLGEKDLMRSLLTHALSGLLLTFPTKWDTS